MQVTVLFFLFSLGDPFPDLFSQHVAMRFLDLSMGFLGFLSFLY